MLDQSHPALDGQSVSIRDLQLDFGSVSVLRDLNLDIHKGEFLVLRQWRGGHSVEAEP